MARDKRRNPVNVQQVSAARQDGQPLERTLLAPVETEISDLTGRVLTAGAGMTGGGDLSANRTFDVGAGTGIIVGASTVAADFGAGAGKVTEGNDARLSNARVPTAHAATHAAAGSDPVTLTEAQITGLIADLAARALLTDARFTDARTPLAHAASHMGGSDPLVAIGASVFQTVAQTGLANSAQTAMVYDGVNFNTNGIYNVANKTRLTAPRTGVYLLTASTAPLGAGIVSPLAAFCVLKINNDATKQIAVASGAIDGSQNSACVATAIYRMTAGDYVEAYVRIRGTSGTWATSGNSLESMGMIWLGD